MEKLGIEDLEKIQESNKASINTEKVIDILLAAINDWPVEVSSLEDYESEVSSFIGGEVTKKAVITTQKRIDISKDAWKAESLSGVIDIFKFYYNNLSLKEIIKKFKAELEEEKLI